MQKVLLSKKNSQKQLVSVAEQNIALIDEVIDFAGSERATQVLGTEGLD